MKTKTDVKAKKNTLSGLMAVIVLLHVVPAMAEPDLNFLRITPDIPMHQQRLIRDDLLRLQSLQIHDTKPELAKVMDLEMPATSEGLIAWLKKRVRVIVSERFVMNNSAIPTLQKEFSFQNPFVFPEEPDLIVNPTSAKEGGLRTVMSNIGLSIYTTSKKAGELLGIQLPGNWMIIPVKSPRVGILRMGSAFFEARYYQKEFSLTKADSSFLRLSTLFHEARHSDGNGKSLGMSHVLCTKGHDYEGTFSCDASLNGAYAVGAEVLQAFVDNCADCSLAEKEVLRLEILDSRSRLLPTRKVLQEVDRYALKTLSELKSYCEGLRNRNQQLPADCENIGLRLEQAKSLAESRSQIIPASMHDSRPEGDL